MDRLSAPDAGRMRRRTAGGRWAACLLALCLVAGGARPAEEPDREAGRRRAMVNELRDHIGPDISRRTLDAMRRVPRHAFVPPAERPHAYENRPLPIGHGQTISQPYIVALMTDLADPDPGDRILEVGTGSGYQAAVLALLAGEVYSIEIIEPLAAQAAQRLRAPTYANVRTRVGDGYYGWKEAGPFDAIVVTAAAGNVPPPLIAQLKPGGRMVIPVGASFFTQQLLLVTKDKQGKVRTRSLLPVRFVPLTGEH